MIAPVWPSLKAAVLPVHFDWTGGLEDADGDLVEQNRAFLDPVLSRAPYLQDLSNRFPETVIRLLRDGPDSLGVDLQADARAARGADTVENLARLLRLAKTRLSLVAGLAEIGGQWTTQQVTRALSDMADATLDSGLDWLVRDAAGRDKFLTGDRELCGRNCGLTLFALGKHGGQELNYSSDIDIVAFYDPGAGVLADPMDASKTYSRLVQKLVGLMEDRTADGYVFRTDLRLRPDPGSTPVAISVDAALAYYEARGQNWERAAWIKARPAAGDLPAGEAFLEELAPFVWRKHLDFAAIADIQAMKRQINMARKVGAARVGGHNVKLGRGGIREIEFFTQTQQLIAGGREPNLRVRPTSEGLAALAQDRWITTETAESLTETYWFLRAVENRVQMLRDEQTHTLPEDAEGVADISALMGFDDPDDFRGRYRRALDLVIANYTNLFTEGTSLSGTTGDLVFTGSEDDPGTLETLTGMGFEDPQRVSSIIRKWHYGGYAATRSGTARAHLTELLPLLLETFAAAGNADAALTRFDNFLSRLPAGVPFFSILRSHTELCRLLVAFMASAPKMADAVVRRAHVLDGLIDPSRSEEVIDPEVLTGKLNTFLGEAANFEDMIDRARILGQEQMFLISAGLISGTLSARQAGNQFTTIADTLIGRLFEETCREFERRHGRIEGARVGILGFGKLGSREMTVRSDLDMILLYDVPEGGAESDGERPLAPVVYFTRLTQRLIAAISAPTATGVLYEVDMRLRPSGNAGPVATSFPAFRAYQLEKAWTWEHLALTRARVIVADPGFASDVNAFIGTVFGALTDRAKIIADCADMRARLARDRPPRHRFDLKLADGGMIDLDFIAQSAALLFGSDLLDVRGDTAATLKLLAARGDLPEGETLAETYDLMALIVAVMSACLNDPFRDDGWTGAFEALLARLANQPDFERLETEIQERMQLVRDVSARWLGPPRDKS